MLLCQDTAIVNVYGRGLASYLGVLFLKDRFKIDDALDVSSIHGIPGIIGSMAIGIFASTAINPAGANGLLYGNANQLLIQGVGVGIAAALGFGGTYVIMKVIDILIGIRVDPKVEELGLDIAEHAERAYSDEDELEKI
jgi:ammonium transporter, Amt family